MKYGRAEAKIGETVHALALGSGPIEDRVVPAWIQYAGTMAGAVPSYMPPELQPEYDAIHHALTRGGSGAMSEHDAQLLVRRIMDLQANVGAVCKEA